MSTNPPSPNADKPKVGETACGATILVTPKTPFVHYRDEIVYFCGQDCLDLYNEDPYNSCLAARLLSGR